MKAEADAVFNQSRKIGAIAAILRDSQGNFIAGSARKVPCASSLIAEAITVLLLEMVSSLHVTVFVIEFSWNWTIFNWLNLCA